jgi:putative transposase
MPQSFTCLHYHLIFSTKNRLPAMTPDLQPRLYGYIGGLLRSEKSILLAAGGMPDHVHLLCASFAWQAGYGAFAVSYAHLDSVKRYIGHQAEHHRRTSFQEEFVAFLRKHHVAFDERYLWD